MVLLNISYKNLYVEFFSENITAYLNDKRDVVQALSGYCQKLRSCCLWKEGMPSRTCISTNH